MFLFEQITLNANNLYFLQVLAPCYFILGDPVANTNMHLQVEKWEFQGAGESEVVVVTVQVGRAPSYTIRQHSLLSIFLTNDCLSV